jgi:preprotein translocase subunit SecE
MSISHPFKVAIAYVRESKQELEKVSWPTRRETVRNSILVIGAAVVMGAFFAGLDWALNLGLEQLIGLTS